MSSILKKAALAVTFAAAMQAACASDYPSQPIKIVVNSAPGGPTDVLARLLSAKMSPSLKQPIVVENKAGAGGNIGVEAVAKASPDGYTLLLAVDNVFTVNPLIYKKTPFDVDKDLRAVAQVGESQMILVVNSKTKVKTMEEFIQYTKRAKVNYSSAGNGSPGHLTFEYLAHELDLNAQHVPYKGNAPAIQAVLAGDVDAGFLGAAGVLPSIKSGKVNAIAVASPTRLPSLPDVPTIASKWSPGFDVSVGFYLMAPAGTPDAVVARLYESLKSAMDAAELRTQLSAALIDPVLKDGKSSTARIQADRAKWKKVVDTAGINVE